MKSIINNPLRLAGAAALAAAVTTSATQSFSNRGTLDGWPTPKPENKGKVEEVNNVFYTGSSNSSSSISDTTALKFTQIWDPTWPDRFHSEVVHEDAMAKGDEGFYGFAFRLQSDWEFDPPQSYNLAQFIADFGDLGCGEDYMPGTMVWIVGNELRSRVKHGEVCPKEAQETNDFDGQSLATVTAGEWHRVVIQASWQSDDSGFFKLWFDGEKVVEEYDIPTNVGDGRAFQFRVGLYANGWFDDDEGNASEDQDTRQVWFDQIAIGSEFGDADPDQW